MKNIVIILGVLGFLFVSFSLGRKRINFNKISALKFSVVWVSMMILVTSVLTCIMGQKAFQPISFHNDNSPFSISVVEYNEMKEKFEQNIANNELSPFEIYEGASLLDIVEKYYVEK